MTEPLGYLDFLCLMKHSELVITDSGGIQEETTCLEVRCVTLRESTERPITLAKGTNILAGTQKERIQNAIRLQLAETNHEHFVPEKWDGQAATRIVATLAGMRRSSVLQRDASILRQGVGA